MSTVRFSTANHQTTGGTQPSKPEQKPKDRPPQPQQPVKSPPRQSNDLHARIDALRFKRAIERSVVSLVRPNPDDGSV